MDWKLRSRSAAIAVCGLFFVGHANAITGGTVDSTLELGQCEEHLRAMVSHLRKEADQKGKAILVEWNADGVVILRYEHFAQRMRCHEGVLLVDYPGLNPPVK